MWAAVAAIFQIIYLILKNNLEKDADERKRKNNLQGEAKEAIASRDASRIVGILDKIKNK